MKDKAKRSIAISAVLAILLSLFPAINAHAATGTFELEEHGQYTYKFTDSYPSPFGKHLEERTWYTYKIKKSDGSRKIAYCIQYGVPASTTTDFNHQTTYGKLNATEKKLLRRALIFGYNDKTGALYGGSWLDNAMATQAMVWMITSGQYGSAKESKIADVCLMPNPKARDIYDKIRSNMEEFDTIPSFASSTANAKNHVMKYNPANGKFELTLTDSNKMLSYFDFQSSDISVQKSGNKLTLSSAKEIDSVLLSANKKLPKDKLPTLVNGALEYWTDNTYQHSTTLDVSGTPEKISAYFKPQTEKLGKLKLLKQSEDGVVANLKFKITGNGINGTYITNEKGELLVDNLIAGDYTITEVSAPDKYVQPKTQVVTVKPEQTTAVTFNNVLKKFNIYITKSDEETGNTPQGDATLSGAEYDIYNEQGDLVEHIKADGTTAKSSLLPLGSYKVYETVPPTGYNLNSKPATVVGDFAGQTVEIGRADTGISDRVIKGQAAVVKFTDAPLIGDTDDGGVKQPLENIEFTLTLKSTGKTACKIVTNEDGYAITPLLPYGLYRIEETKGAEGYRRIRPFDIKIDQDGKIYKYILENKVYETDVKIVKKDKETGKTIPLAGTQFKIKDSEGNWVTQKYNYPTPTILDTYETAPDGTLVLPEPLRYGDYQLYEVKAPEGYTVSKEPIPFTVSSDNPSTMLEVVCSNQPVKGTVTIEKLGERFTGSDFRMTEHGKLFTPIYELQGLEGISFDIIAAEDITTPDGTIRYKADTVVDTITTGKDCKATSKPLYLGKYQAVEKNTLDGFVLDTEKHPFELVYKDQNTELVSTQMRIENQRQKARMSLVKEAEMLCAQTNSPYPSILFGAYAKDDILTAGGEIGIEKGAMVDVFTVDDLGNGLMNTDIPAGSYYIKELVTGDGYLLNEAEYPFTFNHMGQKEPVIRIHLNDGKPLHNKLMRGAIEIIKTSEDKKIEGISFKVQGKTVVGTEYENTFQTDKDGAIFIENLPMGEYTISEVLDDKTVGYITPDSQTVKVENGGTAMAQFENVLQRGAIKIMKSAEGETDLQDFEFEVMGTSLNGTKYKETFKTDKDGTIEVRKLLVGEYTIKEVANRKSKAYILPKDQKTTVEHGKTSIVKVENKRMKEVVKMSVPKTGDGRSIVPFMILLGSSLAVAGACFLKKRKSRKS